NALNTLAAYARTSGHLENADRYAAKARQLIDQFDQAALKNYPQGTAYAYATPGKFFHDGWYPPMDTSDGPPSSLIAAVWRCFAGLGLDPLTNEQIAGVAPVDVSVPKIAESTHLPP